MAMSGISLSLSGHCLEDLYNSLYDLDHSMDDVWKIHIIQWGKSGLDETPSLNFAPRVTLDQTSQYQMQVQLKCPPAAHLQELLHLPHLQPKRRGPQRKGLLSNHQLLQKPSAHQNLPQPQGLFPHLHHLLKSSNSSRLV